MLTKIIFLLFASVALASHLELTVKELQIVYLDITVNLLDEADGTEDDIKNYGNLMKGFTEDTAKDILGNLTNAAQPYWRQLALIQAQAEADGKNISECVELGNKQLYALNNTVVSPLIRQVNLYYAEGNELLTSNSGVINNVVEGIRSFEPRVNACSNNTCADELSTEIIKYYPEALKTIEDSLTKSVSYVTINLPPKLAELTIDSDAYAKSYAPFIEDVQKCSNNK